MGAKERRLVVIAVTIVFAITARIPSSKEMAGG